MEIEFIEIIKQAILDLVFVFGAISVILVSFFTSRLKRKETRGKIPFYHYKNNQEWVV
jgi:hypothetical protein